MTERCCSFGARDWRSRNSPAQVDALQILPLDQTRCRPRRRRVIAAPLPTGVAGRAVRTDRTPEGLMIRPLPTLTSSARANRMAPNRSPGAARLRMRVPLLSWDIRSPSSTPPAPRPAFTGAVTRNLLQQSIVTSPRIKGRPQERPFVAKIRGQPILRSLVLRREANSSSGAAIDSPPSARSPGKSAIAPVSSRIAPETAMPNTP